MPLPLLALLGAVAIVTGSWAIFNPPWQAPDETQHFGYLQSLAERFALPGQPGRLRYSSEHRLADQLSKTGQEARLPGAEWDPRAFRHWKRLDAALPPGSRENGGGRNSARTNPPLYYLYETPVYKAADASIFNRLVLLRLWSGLWALVTAAAAWLLAGEVLGRRRLLQLAAAALAGLHPGVTFISAAVNPDSMMIALWSLAFWLGARILKRGLNPIDAAGFCGAVGLGVVTKATTYALIPAVLFVLGVGAWRLGRVAARRAVVVAAVGVLAFAVPAGGWIATARSLDRPAVNQVSDRGAGPLKKRFNPRGFASYLRQFYLPLPGLSRNLYPATLPVYSVWFKGAWGTFGWRQFRLPATAFFVVFFVLTCCLAAAVVAVVRRRVPRDWAVLAFFAVAVVSLLVALHVTEYRVVYLAKERGDFTQGRYLLPLVAVGGVVVAAGCSVLRPRWRGYAVGALLAGLLVLQLIALGTVAEWFYA